VAAHFFSSSLCCLQHNDIYACCYNITRGPSVAETETTDLTALEILGAENNSIQIISCTIQARRADVMVSSGNGSALPGEPLHTNCQRCWSSASAVHQSAKVDRSLLLSEQFQLSVFCCCGSIDLEFASRQSLRPRLSLNMLRHQLKTYHTFLRMRNKH